MKLSNNQRDISLLKIDDRQLLVIACDSAGAIGQKPADKVRVSNYILGKYTAKVALMEVMSVGAEVISVVNNLAVEYNSTGREIIGGIKENLKLIGISDLLNGSTEENFETVQTGIGVTVIGRIRIAELENNNSNKNNIIVAVGLPLIGNEILKAEEKTVTFADFLKIRELNYIDQILPVGSKGILHEINVLAAENNLDYQLISADINLKKSAGPASVILVSIKKDDFKKLKIELELPVTKVAELI